MEKCFDDLPGWCFRIEETSSNVWSLDGIGPHGLSVAKQGTDMNALLESAKADAETLMKRVSDDS